jgi:hypothetical protein
MYRARETLGHPSEEWRRRRLSKKQTALLHTFSHAPSPPLLPTPPHASSLLSPPSPPCISGLISRGLPQLDTLKPRPPRPAPATPTSFVSASPSPLSFSSSCPPFPTPPPSPLPLHCCDVCCRRQKFSKKSVDSYFTYQIHYTRALTFENGLHGGTH